MTPRLTYRRGRQAAEARVVNRLKSTISVRGFDFAERETAPTCAIFATISNRASLAPRKRPERTVR